MDEGDVQVSGPQGVGDRRRVGLADHRLQPRVAPGEGHQGGRDDRAGGGGEGADAQGSGEAAAGFGEVGVGLFQPLQDGLGVPDQVLPGGGEPDPPSGAFQQGQAGLPLQHAELLGHRRRAEGEGLGDGGDGAAAGEFAQQAQASYVEHRISLRVE